MKKNLGIIAAFAVSVTACGPAHSGSSQNEGTDAQGTDCASSITVPTSGALSKSEWLDGTDGDYVLDSMQFFAKSGSGQSFTDLVVKTHSADLVTGPNPGAPQIGCTFDSTSSQMNYGLSGNASLPRVIHRHDGSTSDFFKIQVHHNSAHPTSDTVTSSSMSVPSAHVFLQLLDNAPSGLALHVYRPDSATIQVLAVISGTDPNGNAEFVQVLGNYHFLPMALPGPIPTSTMPPVIAFPMPVATPVPSILPTPNNLPSPPVAPAPVAFPFPIPSPAPTVAARPGNLRCGANAYAVTIDGHSAFYASDDGKRLDMLSQLVASGFCAAPSRLGANAYAVTLDEVSAAYFDQDEARMAQLIRLFQAGLGSDQYKRCGARQGAITLDGHSAFYINDAKDLVDKLINMASGGLCSTSR